MAKDRVEKLVQIIYVPLRGNPFPMNIEPSVEMFQSLVEGFFDFRPIDTTTIMCINDDQWTEPINFTLNGRPIRGAVFFIGMSGREWLDCPWTVDEIMNLVTREKETEVENGNTV